MRDAFIIFAQPKECIVGLTNTQLTRAWRPRRSAASDHDRGPTTIGDHCTDGMNLEPARPLREILMDHRQMLESVDYPAAYARRIDRLMSMPGPEAASRYER